MLGLFDLTILPAAGEAPVPPGTPVWEAVQSIAAGKALDAARRAGPDSLILGADTVVVLEGRVLGKPRDEEDAFRMLRALSGRKHTVYTGMALRRGEESMTDYAAAEVWFRELTDREIRAYIATGSPMDKAGSYGAQDMAALFVERIDGEFYTVVGLPICRLGRMMRRFGVDIWGNDA
jgi:septum formation protein